MVRQITDWSVKIWNKWKEGKSESEGEGQGEGKGKEKNYIINDNIFSNNECHIKFQAIIKYAHD